MNTSQLQEYADNAILSPTYLYELSTSEALDGSPVFNVEHGEYLS